MNLFKISSTVNIIDECCEMFNMKCTSQLIAERKGKYLGHFCNGNAVNALLADFAFNELLIFNLWAQV